MNLLRLPSNLLQRPRLAAGLGLAFGLVLTALATAWQVRDNARVAQRQFDTLAQDVMARLGARLHVYEYGLLGARGAMLDGGPQRMDRARYERYSASRDIDREFRGARGNGVIWRVPEADEAAFVAAARRDGAPEFAVRQLAPRAGERYVITYIEPLARNRQALGLDIASEDNRRTAAEAAARTGQATLTAPITLVQASGLTQRAFLLLLPIYRAGAPVASAEQRTAAAIGWTYAPMVMDEVLADLALHDPRFTIALRDRTQPQAFFTTPGADVVQAERLAHRAELPVYGRTWDAELHARPAFLRGLGQTDPRLVAAIGAALSVLLGLLAHLLAQSTRREQHVRDEQARRAAIVDSSGDAIIGESLDGIVTDWNAGAERLFGYTAAQILGRPLVGLLVPQGHEAEDAAIRAAAARGEVVAAHDTVRRGRDGRPIEVSVAASPIIGYGGRCVGIAKTVRDIGPARRTERQIRELNATLEQRVAERTGALEAALRENGSLLNTIRLHTIFSVADPQGKIVEVNDNFCRTSGYAAEELLGQDYRVVDSGLHDESFWADMWKTLRAGQPWRGEICDRAKDGTPYWVDGVIAPFVDADGRIVKYISVHRDITPAKLADQKLRASQAFLDRVGTTAGVGGWQLDLDPIVITWSTQTYRIHELEPGAVLDVERGISFFPGAARETLRTAVDACIAHGTGYDLELPFVTAKGRALWVRTVGSAEWQDGKVTRLVGALQDITERKRAEALLQQAHDRFAVAAAAGSFGVWDWDLTTGALTWDARMYRMYGRTPSADVEAYEVWAGSLHPDDKPASEAALQAALRGEREFDVEFRIVWPSGEVRHLTGNAHVIRDEAGQPLRVTGVNTDITVRKRAEAELRETSSLLRTVLESASEVSIIAGDPQLNITVFNAGAERLLGYRADEIVGRGVTPALIHDPAEIQARAAELTQALGRPVEGGAVFIEPITLGQPREWTYVRKDGSRVQVSLIVTAMYADDGSLSGYLGIAHDVTRQKEYQESLRRAMHKAKHASLAKSQFLANMSHEIRTPMNAVIGLTYLLGQTALDAEQADSLNKIRIASRSLLVVINDVLDLSKIEAGELTLEHAPFALRSVLHELGDMMSVEAQAKHIRFTIDAPRDLPTALMGDATRLHQVLTNLVANAVKFTDHGGVTLAVRVCDAAPERATLRFTVRDSGIGIPPEIQAKLFAPFAQGDTSTTRRFGGTGLGLSIVKRVVTLMGGEVGLESTPGVGSEFRVEVPFVLADPGQVEIAMPAPAAAGRRLPGVRVLVADDSEINLEVAKRILELEGASVALAENGEEAVARLRAQPDGFDLVLMDVQMPVLDGHAATRCIRNELGLSALPVIALTAGALSSEHQRASASGMDDFVSKPFDAHGLVRTILRHVGQLVDAGEDSMPAALAPAPADDSWPEIDGIDAQDVRSRLAGDLDLFRSMLMRLLKEFADIGAPEHRPDAAALDVLAARMHKLRGSASMLGAKPLAQLAGHAETACRAGDALRAVQWLRKTATQLDRLRTRSVAALERLNARADESGAASSVERVDPQVVHDLIALLNQQSMSALDRFKQIAPGLRHELGDPAYQQLRDEIENLQFQRAAQTLGAI